MNVTKLLSAMTKVGKAEFAGIVTRTSVKIPKKWGLLDVTKVTEKGVQLNYSYESAVNRHYDAEGIESEFVAEPLPWGEWLMPNKVIINKGKHYLRAYDYDNNVKSTKYYVGNRPATDEEVAIINEWYKSKNTTSRQECEKKVRPTAIDFANIIRIAIHGEVLEGE